MEIIRGRGFDRDMGTDEKEAFVVNEALAQKMGWGNEALGKRLQFGLQPDGGAQRDGKVIGVVRDFNFDSLHNEVAPLAILLNKDPPSTSSACASNRVRQPKPSDCYRRREKSSTSATRWPMCLSR